MSYYPPVPPYDQHPPPPPHGHHPPPHHHPPPPHHHPPPPHHHPPPPHHHPPPPHHHPPPPHHHPPSPPPGSYAYVPTPVMMPVYPQQPVYPVVPEYHGTPQVAPVETVKVVENAIEDVIDWKPATTQTAYNFSNIAVVAGHEGHDGSPLWVIRAHHSGDLIPGKLAVKHKSAFIPYGGREIPVHSFDVLCANADAVRWLPASNGQVPLGAIPAGNTASAEPLYIGRTRHMLSLTPGKVHPSQKCCFISFGGTEISSKTYEVLCKIIG